MIKVKTFKTNPYDINVRIERDPTGEMTSAMMVFANRAYTPVGAVELPNSVVTPDTVGFFEYPHPIFQHPAHMLNWILGYLYELEANTCQLGDPSTVEKS